MPEPENISSTNDGNNNKKKSGDYPAVITPFMGHTEAGEHLVTLGEATPVEYSIKPAAAEPVGSKVYNIVKPDHRSSEQRKKDYELKREATIQNIMDSLSKNKDAGAEVVSEMDQDLSGEMIAELVKEARSRLQKQRAEAEEIKESRKAEFQRKLQANRAVCQYCHALLGWSLDSEDRHLETCSAYREHKKQEEERMLRQKHFVQRYERLLDFDIPRSVSALEDTINAINEIRFVESEAIFTSKDSAITEGLHRIKEKISSESDYERRRRQKQIADLRYAATTIESLYRRLDEPQE
jgi:hypothetical protein